MCRLCQDLRDADHTPEDPHESPCALPGSFPLARRLTSRRPLIRRSLRPRPPPPEATEKNCRHNGITQCRCPERPVANPYWAVLRVHTLDRSARARAYFDDVTRPDGGGEDYFTGHGEGPGHWTGSALGQVGLEGGQHVEPDALSRLVFDGLHPTTSEPLGRRTRAGDGIAGFGATFSAPKSVSLLWALANPAAQTQVMAAHHAAVDAGVDYLERHACYARRGSRA